MAFVSSNNSGNSNQAYGSKYANTDSMSDAVIYSFFANQSNSPQLNDEDLQQIDVDDLEGMDLKWQMVMLTMRARRFLNKTRRKINANGSETIGFNESKSDQAEEEPTNFALMAYTSSSSSSSDSELRKKFEKAEKERDDLKLTLEKFENSSKKLSKLLDSQVCDKFKTSVGFDSQVVDSQMSDSQENDRYKTGEGYHAVPPPYTGNFMPPKSDLVLADVDEYVFSELVTSIPDVATSKAKTSESKPKCVGEPLIEDWISDSEDENETESKSKQRKSSFANVKFVKTNEHVKTPMESVKKVKNDKQAKYPRKNSQSPRGNQRNWNNLMTQKLGSNFEFKNKACYVCGSFNHLIKDCDFYEKKMVEKPVWNNARRVNHQNSQRMTHPHPKRNFVPRAVLMKSGLKTLNTARQNSSRAAVSVNTARPINTAYPKPTVNCARPASNVFNRAHSHVRRPFNMFTSNKNSNFNEKVNTVKGNVTTVRPKAVVSDEANAVKASACWVWRPKQKVLDHVSRHNGASMNFKRFDYGNPQLELQEKGVIDSGCSRHMTGNKSYLSDYEEIDGGFVAFGGDPKGGKITGKGKISTGKLDFEDVYFVKELKFNLFSVSQMCDKKNSVLFTDTECVVLSPDFKLLDENHVLLRVPRKDNMYSVDLKNIVPSGGLTYLFAKATLDESNLWHRRLGHINFKTMNKLVRGNLVRGKFDGKADEGFFVGYSTNSKAFMVFNSTLQKRQFGCHVTILNTLDYLGKFDGKSDKGFFVGYLMNSKAFRVYNIRTRKVEENFHIRFLEDNPIIVGNGPKWLFDIDVLTKSMNYVPVLAGTNSNDLVGTEESIGAGHSSKETGSSQDHILIPLWKDGLLFDSSSKNASNDEPQLPSDAGKKDDEVTTALLEATRADFFGDETKEEPKKVIQALKDPSWIEAIQEELLKFKLQQVWTLVDLPHGKRAISTKWMYRNKKDKRGIVIRNKARLVTQGYTQEEGIDHDEVFALVARIEVLRLFLVYASFKDFVVYQMDVKSAFLYGKIKEEVYVCQPPGFEDPEFPDRVYKVEKALYGLHQALRAWYETFSTYLLDNRFQRVDDIIFGSTKKELCTEFEKLMHKKFQMSSMGELTFFLGLQVTQKDDGIFISQDKYVDEILKKFGFSTVKTASTPMETSKPLMKDENAEDVDVHLYRSMIGSLMYLTSSRPDIMFVVCACARFQVTPKVSHLHAVKRIFRYLKGQPKLGLWYPKDSPFDLEAYTDSDYAGASLDRKSTTGAEYVAAASCCGQVLWIQNQMLDYGYNFMNTKIFIDNESTICIVKNPVFHSKTKHIEIRHHFIKDSNEKKLIQMIKIHTDQNVTDLLTKAFDVGRFQYLIASIGMLNL
ncbi:putative ribonuclease H-like domain-containing protein [Tanacetum coccineum]